VKVKCPGRDCWVTQIQVVLRFADLIHRQYNHHSTTNAAIGALQMRPLKYY
jgi:hypothetical protein